ncbi:mannobiose 2-epimerase [Chitinophaga skermanii]|uniref:Cellobiose 2-epimerase n=1 Tax=Chitinophaga skermanii TaxID=331697 RepID=A0A327QDI7_9BACT|nr:AGE family epimerase/isomerase [Chitinophaga skermanii]RAJ02371.1 mannobiose 2-epimerase [Chitinophaga skermanii]
MKTALKQALQAELNNILYYWSSYTVDEQSGGFYGRLQNDNSVDPYALKGAVLNARILWTFAAAYRRIPKEEYIVLANRAYSYISEHFIDREFGGVYWSLNYTGQPVDTKKQVYAIAFTIYAFSEYYLACKDEKAKEQAILLYNILEQHAVDKNYGGYFEAFTREWKEMTDQRLSLKDANERKSMNTHLHVLEAYTTLYKAWPDAQLKSRIVDILNIFDQYIFNHSSKHLQLFFNDEWQVKGHIESYGHDIEAAWLMQEAAEAIQDETLILHFKQLAIEIADITFPAFDKDGGLWYEREGDHLVKEKHWWPQAEAIVGYVNAYQLSGEEKYLQQAVFTWQFVEERIVDNENGEWFWGIDENNQVMQEDKVGLWKCPYHNGRACLEIMDRLK